MQSAEQVKIEIVGRASADSDFRSRLLSDPRAAVTEVIGMDFPKDMGLSVHEDDATNLHFVLPPSNLLDASQLEAVAGGGCRAGEGYAEW